MKYLRKYNESRADSFDVIKDDLTEEISDIFFKINELVNSGGHLNNGERVIYKKGQSGTVVKTGSDCYIEWDENGSSVGKFILPKKPSVRLGGDWKGGYEFLKADLKPEYDKLYKRLKELQFLNNFLSPAHTQSGTVTCTESKSKFKVGIGYKVLTDNSGQHYIRKTNLSADWEPINMMPDGYTWVGGDATFVNFTIEKEMKEYNKKKIQQRFDL